MHLMFQYYEADDRVAATYEPFQEVVELAFWHAELDWGNSHSKQAFREDCGVEFLVGDSGKARTRLGWQKRSISLNWGG